MYPSAWAIDVMALLSLYAGTARPSTMRTVWNSTRPIADTTRRVDADNSVRTHAEFAELFRDATTLAHLLDELRAIGG